MAKGDGRTPRCVRGDSVCGWKVNIDAKGRGGKVRDNTEKGSTLLYLYIMYSVQVIKGRNVGAEG